MDTKRYYNNLIHSRFSLLKLFLILFVTTSVLNSQPFQISSHWTSLFTIDRFTNEVYYKHFPNIYKTELKTLSTTLAEFPTLPVFANKNHLAAYRVDDTIFVKDFNLNTS